MSRGNKLRGTLIGKLLMKAVRVAQMPELLGVRGLARQQFGLSWPFILRKLQPGAKKNIGRKLMKPNILAELVWNEYRNLVSLFGAWVKS